MSSAVVFGPHRDTWAEPSTGGCYWVVVSVSVVAAAGCPLYSSKAFSSGVESNKPLAVELSGSAPVVQPGAAQAAELVNAGHQNGLSLLMMTGIIIPNFRTSMQSIFMLFLLHILWSEGFIITPIITVNKFLTKAIKPVVEPLELATKAPRPEVPADERIVKGQRLYGVLLINCWITEW